MRMEFRNGNERYETTVMVLDGVAAMYGWFAGLSRLW